MLQQRYGGPQRRRVQHSSPHRKGVQTPNERTEYRRFVERLFGHGKQGPIDVSSDKRGVQIAGVIGGYDGPGLVGNIFQTMAFVSK
jgi:hypothetical protein